MATMGRALSIHLEEWRGISNFAMKILEFSLLQTSSIDSTKTATCRLLA
jgi:hypothetical protein